MKQLEKLARQKSKSILKIRIIGDILLNNRESSIILLFFSPVSRAAGLTKRVYHVTGNFLALNVERSPKCRTIIPSALLSPFNSIQPLPLA